MPFLNIRKPAMVFSALSRFSDLQLAVVFKKIQVICRQVKVFVAVASPVLCLQGVLRMSDRIRRLSWGSKPAVLPTWLSLTWLTYYGIPLLHSQGLALLARGTVFVSQGGEFLPVSEVVSTKAEFRHEELDVGINRGAGSKGESQDLEVLLAWNIGSITCCHFAFHIRVDGGWNAQHLGFLRIYLHTNVVCDPLNRSNPTYGN